MKILFKSIYLFIFGVYVEAYKRSFDRIIDKRIKKGRSISDSRLTKMSDRSYWLYMKFKDYEKDLKYEILIRNIAKNTV